MDQNDTDSDSELPPGWEERATFNGDVYYVNHLTKATDWKHPLTGQRKQLSPELPYGWQIQQDENETVFYYDSIRDRTTYTDPRLAFAEEITPRNKTFRQRFDGHTTAMQVVQGRDLRGRFAIVTGSNTGIGFESLRTLALHGCHVVMASRNKESSMEAISKIRVEHNPAIVKWIHLDLSSLKSVRMFAETYLKSGWPLHYLILNAGVFSPPHSVTEDGYEITFQVNHLANHYLTKLLMPVLINTKFPSPRVIVVSSESHRFPSVNHSNFTESQLCPLKAEDCNPVMQYGTTKLCGILFARHLDRLYNESENIHSYACHPGNMINTGISRNWWLYRLIFYMVKPFTKSLQQGAASILYCAVHKDMASRSGIYVNNCCICEPSSMAKRDDLAELLWNISEDMIARFEARLQP